jgi:hypothetical protein
MHEQGDVFFAMPLAQTWHAIGMIKAMEIITRYKLGEYYYMSRQGRPSYALTFVWENGMKPISHLLIEACLISQSLLLRGA